MNQFKLYFLGHESPGFSRVKDTLGGNLTGLLNDPRDYLTKHFTGLRDFCGQPDRCAHTYRDAVAMHWQ